MPATILHIKTIVPRVEKLVLYLQMKRRERDEERGREGVGKDVEKEIWTVKYNTIK
jgi:hypothetical protein